MTINRFEEEERDRRVSAEVRAEKAWNRMTEAEKVAVRFGMLPIWVRTDPEFSLEDPREMAVALYGCAKKTGGMIA